MIPLEPHVPPLGNPVVSAKVWTRFPSISIRFSLPKAKKPIERLSGDQNGNAPSSVPGSILPCPRSFRPRNHSINLPWVSITGTTSCLPSGREPAEIDCWRRQRTGYQQVEESSRARPLVLAQAF